MLPKWFARVRLGPRAPCPRRALDREPADGEGHRDSGDSGYTREDNDDREQPWRIAALRAMGSLGLVFFCAEAMLWFFVFRGAAWQALLSLSLGGFLGSWIAALWGVRIVAERPRKRTTFSAEPDPATRLARCGIFVGVFGFVAFFLMAYR